MQPWDCRHCNRSVECMQSVLTRGEDEGIIGDYIGGELAYSACESRTNNNRYKSIESRMDEVQAIIERQAHPIMVKDILAVYEVNETILQQVLARLRNDNRVHARQFMGSRRWYYFHKPIGDGTAPRSMNDTISQVAKCKLSGMTLADTAKHLGMHTTTVSRYINLARHQGLLPPYRQ